MDQLIRMVLIALLAGVAAGILVWVTGDVGQRLRAAREARAEERRLRDEAEAAKAKANPDEEEGAS